MNSSKVDVSVVIPAYNAAGTVGAALRSALEQTYARIEVLVIDDGATDETSAVVSSFVASDSRVRLIQQRNAGVGAARNTGIRMARGAYIAPLDADDTWEPEKLERQIERMEALGDGCGMVYCGSNIVDANHRWLSSAPLYVMEGRLHRALILQNFVGNASVPLFRTAALQEVGPYLERSEQGGVQGCEDWDLAIRVAERFEIGAVREHLVNYRQMDSAMTLNHRGMARSYAALMKRARARNTDVPETVFRRSAGRFYSYLAKRCYRWSDYAGCVSCFLQAIRADPRTLLNKRFYELVTKSVFCSAAKCFQGNVVHRYAPTPASVEVVRENGVRAGIETPKAAASVNG